MTKIFLFKKNGVIYACQIKGHSCYADKGQDIVCSAVSTASQMALIGIEQVLGLSVEVEQREGFLSFKILEGAECEGAQTILVAMEKTFENLAKDYAKNVKLEVRKDDIV